MNKGNMGRRGTEEGALMRRFAERMGCSVQWARALRRRDAQAWRDFVAGSPSSAPSSAPEPPAPSAAASTAPPSSALSRAAAAVDAQWAAYERARRLADAAAATPEAPALLPGLNRSITETLRAYERASAHLFTLQQQAREYVPISSVRAMKSALSLLEDVAANHRQRIAARLPDASRPAFFEAFDAVFADWNTGIEKADAYVNSLMPDHV